MRQKLGLIFGFAINSASSRPLALLPSEQKGESNKYNRPFFFWRRENVLMRNNTFKPDIFSLCLVGFVLHKYGKYCDPFLSKVVPSHFI